MILKSIHATIPFLHPQLQPHSQARICRAHLSFGKIPPSQSLLRSSQAFKQLWRGFWGGFFLASGANFPLWKTLFQWHREAPAAPPGIRQQFHPRQNPMGTKGRNLALKFHPMLLVVLETGLFLGIGDVPWE